ncbi:VQ motif-containing protein 20-like [Primulina huaijiensis]|uniref:VQ motif-containing protein 20-like n=1 Tax=Primulina huaijiensis TaxID=1492673 RepID=UPI003CC70F6E
MSPTKFQDSEAPKGLMINCNPRQSPLRINRDSHAIQKSPSSHQPLVENAGNSSVPASKSQTKRQPVIIYTHSPKVIHAQASDFMALVQKLTGYSRSEEEEGRSIVKPEMTTKDEENDCRVKNVVGYEDHETSSSVLTDEKYVNEFKPETSIVSPPLYNHMPNPYIVEVPFFAPNSNEPYMCSSRAGSVFHSSIMGNPISPSFMDYMKGFPEF